MMSLHETYHILDKAYRLLIELHGQLPQDASADTAFAIGEATGQIAKAKALIGRDIDDGRHSLPPLPSEKTE